MSEPAPFDYRDFLPAQLARLATLAQAVLASALHRCDLTIAHWRILICLTQRGPSALNDVVAFTHLPQSSLSRSVGRLQARGAVTIARDPGDKRRMVIAITGTGHEMLMHAGQVVEMRYAEAFSMEAAEMELFKSTIGHLLSRLSPDGDDQSDRRR